MDSGVDFHNAKALLTWQVELGATEAIGDAPVNRYDVPAAQPKTKLAATPSGPTPAVEVDPVKVATGLANGAADLAALKHAMASFELCDLKRGARNLVFADGDPSARVMIIGEAPGRDEDREGRPFVGRAGQLLDKMFDAIGMARDREGAAIYITNVLPWRPPQNRDPKPEEIAMMRPFVERHVALIDPDLVVLMGNISCQAMIGKRGITRLRGSWTDCLGRPAMPMFHPAYLLRNPAAKREAWADLLEIKAKVSP